MLRRWNPLINYQIIRLISDILNALGAAAVALGAVYVHTDGYVFTTESAYESMTQVVRDWGLTPRLKSRGPGEIRGVGAYALGKIYSRRKLNQTKAIKIIRAVNYAPWLQSRFSALRSLVTVTEESLC